MAIVRFQSFADASHRGIVERHVQCEQSPMNIVESATTSGNSLLQSSMRFLSEAEINNQLQLLFAKTLPLKLRHSDVIDV